ncbi:alpha/beta hydrolase family protein [Hydrogenophaga sp.]|uniref:alpha/beta hydrolase family protein n=1 Tax=Hydrogenophaga sp. TaxID=1904254 RepID=UPI0035B0C28C
MLSSTHPLRLALLGLLCTLASAASAQVGMRDFQAQGIPVTMVYPTSETATPQTKGPFTIEVATDATPTQGRHRLIVMSHGTGGSAIADHALAARLARAGFVVAQPLHTGDNYLDQRLSGPASFEKRPGEVTQVIDALAQDSLWSGRLALDKVGVHGMSAGGVTGIALAGGQWRLLNLVRHCDAHAQDDESFCFQGAKDAQARADLQARYARGRQVPEAFLPADLTTLHGGRSPSTAQVVDPRPDARVASVSLAVPLAAIFSPESLARIRIPVGVVSAQRDEVLVPSFHSDYLLRHCTACTRLADLPGAGHRDVLWPSPDSAAQRAAAEQEPSRVPVPGFDGRLRDAAHDRIVAFHRQHLLPPP